MRFTTDERRQSGYDVAQICLNGHLITSMINRSPEHREKFCHRCGTETTTTCSACNAPIPGYYSSPGVVDLSPYSMRACCAECGALYPWTARRLAAAKELSREADELSDDERKLLDSSLDDLVTDTPRTQLAAMRTKKLIQKIAPTTGGGIRDILKELATTAAKRLLFGPPGSPD